MQLAFQVAVAPGVGVRSHCQGLCSVRCGRAARSILPRVQTAPRPASVQRVVTCRVDRADEGFISCSACGADVLVSVSSFAKRPQVNVKCPECGARWEATSADVFTLDGSANIVSSEQRINEEEALNLSRGALKLYVSGIGPKVTKDALAAAFNEFGQVTNATIVLDRVTGRSRGFGFVTMADESSAEAAMSVLNDSSKLGGRRISVRVARDK